MEQQQLRREKRRLRRALGIRERRRLARTICDKLISLSFFRRARRLAFYSALQRDGELDLHAAWRYARARNKRCFLPVLCSGWRPPRLRFREYFEGSQLRRDRFGILYPARGKLWRGVDLDLILTPLSAFDAFGTRVGMGGGYYDRAFATRALHSRARPYLLGCAYALQQSETIARNSWDLTLDAVISERGLLATRANSSST